MVMMQVPSFEKNIFALGFSNFVIIIFVFLEIIKILIWLIYFCVKNKVKMKKMIMKIYKKMIDPFRVLCWFLI